MEIRCREVRQELENYMEGDVSAERREQIDRHFLESRGCFGIYDGLRRVEDEYGFQIARRTVILDMSTLLAKNLSTFF